jgi:Na+/proline symporter
MLINISFIYMESTSTDILHDFIMILIVVIMGLIILAAMGKFDSFSSRITKKFLIKKRGRIYIDKIPTEKIPTDKTL